MLEYFIQAVGVALAVLLFSVLAKEGNSTVPDTHTFTCSFDAYVQSCNSRIDLCSLEGNIFLDVPDSKRVVSYRTSSGEISIHRFYCINPFGKIQNSANKHSLPVLTNTNCPPNAFSCLVSNVTYPNCDVTQGDNGVCYNDHQITADSYGKRGVPEVSNKTGQDVWTARINMHGGPCYYCDDANKKLRTWIEFYCDERIMGKGTPSIHAKPTKSFPRIWLKWSTSAACYEFDPNEKCNKDFSTICETNSFDCGSKDHKYSLPPSANKSIDFHIDLPDLPRTTYTFGFCAKDVQCPTANDKVMLCKKEGETFTPLAYYSDSAEFVARPTGFVMRISERQSGPWKLVISFECSEPSQADISMSDNLPILLTFKHPCFCPGKCEKGEKVSPGEPSSRPQEELTDSGKSENPNSYFLYVLGGLFGLLCPIVAIVLYIRQRNIRRTRRTRTEVTPPTVGDADNGPPVESEGASLLNRTPSPTYHSCHSDDSMVSCSSNTGSVVHNAGERTSGVEADGETQVSQI